MWKILKSFWFDPIPTTEEVRPMAMTWYHYIVIFPNTMIWHILYTIKLYSSSEFGRIKCGDLGSVLRSI